MIYIVEDDDSIRDLVCYALQSSGFSVQGFDSGKKIWSSIEKERPELILLDIMLPDENGLDILGKLKGYSTTMDISVIMLTAKGDEMDRVRGLDSGADDYISKPFSVMELISRVKALLRRCKTEPVEKITIGLIDLNISQHKVFIDGHEIILTYKEFELLYLLMKNTGIVLSREKLMTTIWGYDFQGESRTLDVHIKSLRQKLGAAGHYIQTIRGVGYKCEHEHRN